MRNTLAMGKFFARSKAGAQSPDRRGNHSIGGISTSSPPSRMIAYVQNKEAHQKAPQSSSSGAVTAKEHELSQRLHEKEVEILELRACYNKEISQKKEEIHSLLGDRAALRRAVENKERDIGEMRGRHNTILSIHRDRQEDSKILLRKADARARVLQESLTTAEEELETCKDDLFRTQPVCQISDASIIDAFESLGEQLVNWIDDQASAFEYANQDLDVGSLVSKGTDLKMAKLLLKYPPAGEYLCRHMLNQYLLEHAFGPNIHLFGLPAEYRHMLATIEQGMAALRPPRGMRPSPLDILSIVVFLTVADSRRINIWRAETLSALATTQEYTNLKEEQSRQVTVNLFESLAATFPHLHEKVEARKGLHEQVTVPAMAIVSKLQELASTYTLDMASADNPNCRRITRNDLKKITAIDLETGKTLKRGSAIVRGREGAIGDLVLPLEPGLRRVKEEGSAIDLRKETWLVRLDESLRI